MSALFTFVILVLTVIALVDIIARDQSEVAHLPKVAWVFVVILAPILGAILWFLMGREPSGDSRWGGSVSRPSPATSTPPKSRVVDTRSTEQQLADLEREIEEDRLRAEIARRRAKADGDGSESPAP